MKAIGESLRSLLVRIQWPFPRIIIVELDSLEAAAILNGEVEDLSEVRTLTKEVEMLATSVGVVSFSFTRRESNRNCALVSA